MAVVLRKKEKEGRKSEELEEQALHPGKDHFDFHRAQHFHDSLHHSHKLVSLAFKSAVFFPIPLFR
jgi:hypothetical protein